MESRIAVAKFARGDAKCFLVLSRDAQCFQQHINVVVDDCLERVHEQRAECDRRVDNRFRGQRGQLLHLAQELVQREAVPEFRLEFTER